MNTHPQLLDDRPDPPSAGAILADAWSRLDRTGLALIIPCVLLGLLASRQGSGGEFEPSGVGEFLVSVGALLLICVVEFSLYVWALRATAPALELTPRPLTVPAVLWTASVASVVFIGGTFLLVLPGIVALLLLALVAPIVAFEGVTGWQALGASARDVRRAPGTVALLLLVLVVAPLPLDIGYWPVVLPDWAIGAWQTGLYTAVSMIGATTMGVAYVRLRSPGEVPGIASAPGVPVGRVVHEWVAPTGADAAPAEPARLPVR